MSDTKPREWWIHKVTGAMLIDRPHVETTARYIHVVEQSALEDAQKEIRKLRGALNLILSREAISLEPDSFNQKAAREALGEWSTHDPK